MKKSNLLLVLLLYLAITSCARLDTPVVPEDSAIPPMTSTFVTEEMAISEVEEFLKNFDPGTKSGSRTIAEIYPSGSMPATRSESDSSGVEMTEPFVYIVNFTNDEGFAIVSGDTRMSPILAITDHGNLEQGEVIDDPGTIAMLANIDVDYRMAVGLPVENPDGGLDYPIGITNNCGYASGGNNESYNYDRLYNKISAGPAYISGCSKKTVKKFLGITVKTTYSGGHAWVIDQVLTQSRTKFTYTDGILTDTATQYRHLVHCNFGWDSNNSSNGYYFSAQFDTNKGPVTRADETGSMSNSQADHYYQYKLNMNINISPR